jgi:hypothetical protein
VERCEIPERPEWAADCWGDAVADLAVLFFDGADVVRDLLVFGLDASGRVICAGGRDDVYGMAEHFGDVVAFGVVATGWASADSLGGGVRPSEAVDRRRVECCSVVREDGSGLGLIRLSGDAPTWSAAVGGRVADFLRSALILRGVSA